MAFTTDAGQRWATHWTGWDQYDRFFSQMVRWSMRPTGDTGKFAVATDVQGSKTRVIVSALDKDDEFLNYQAMSGTVLGPDMQSIPLEIEQTAPGRYVGEFDSAKPGSYMIMVRAGRTGDDSHGREHRLLGRVPRPRNEHAAAGTDCRAAGQGGRAGQAAAAAAGGAGRQREGGANAASRNWRSIRSGAICRRRCRAQDIWPWLVLAASCVFFGDVFVRRVQVDLQWLVPIWTRLLDIVLRRERHEAAPETMARLRSRKAEVDRSIESRRAAARFEPDAALPVDPNAIEAAEATANEHGHADAAPHRNRRRDGSRRLHFAAAQGQEASLARSGAGSWV